MANGTMAGTDNFRSWFMDKLLMGMTWPEYMRTLITPFNVIAALILSVGLPLIGSGHPRHTPFIGSKDVNCVIGGSPILHEHLLGHRDLVQD